MEDHACSRTFSGHKSSRGSYYEDGYSYAASPIAKPVLGPYRYWIEWKGEYDYLMFARAFAGKMKQLLPYVERLK